MTGGRTARRAQQLVGCTLRFDDRRVSFPVGVWGRRAVPFEDIDDVVLGSGGDLTLVRRNGTEVRLGSTGVLNRGDLEVAAELVRAIVGLGSS